MELHEYAAQDAVGLAQLIRSGAITAEEAEDAARRSIAEVEPTLHATVGDLLDSPPEASAEGVFAGVPFALKVSPRKDTVPSCTSAMSTDRYSRMWRTGFSNE